MFAAYAMTTGRQPPVAILSHVPMLRGSGHIGWWGRTGLALVAFALLVLSIRRGSALATAMEARGFGSATARSWARDSPWRAREWVALATGLAVGLTAIAAAIAAGTWNFIVG